MTWPTTSQNLVNGKGRLFLGLYEPNSLVMPTNIRQLGNAPELSATQATTNLEHFSSQQGLQEKDRSVVLRVDFTGKFVLDDLMPENFALWLLGETALETQAATGGGSPIVEVFTDVVLNSYLRIGVTTALPMGVRNLDPATITITRENAGFTHATAATAAAAGAGLTDGTRVFTSTDGTFTSPIVLSATVASGAITGAITVVSGGRFSVSPDVTANAVFTVDSGILGGATFDITMASLADEAVPAGDFVFDAPSGRLYIVAAPTVVLAGDDLNVSYKKLAATRNIGKTGGSQVYAYVEFISNNGVGAQTNFTFPYVLLKPDGDMALIGESWQQMSFAFEALKLNSDTEKCYADGVPITA